MTDECSVVIEDLQNNFYSYKSLVQTQYQMHKNVDKLPPKIAYAQAIEDVRLLTDLDFDAFWYHYHQIMAGQMAGSREKKARTRRRKHRPTTADLIRRPKMKVAASDPLTERELEVLGLLAERLSINEFSARLFISPSTVQQHTHHIYRKLNAANKRQAVARAIELGILTPSH